MDPIWTPTRRGARRARTRCASRALGFDDYAQLVRFSRRSRSGSGRRRSRTWASSSRSRGTPWCDTSRGPEWATWFVGGKLNLAGTACTAGPGDSGRRRGSGRGRARTASGRPLTYRELSDAVTRFAEALAALGVEPGDRVAIFLPMSPQVAVASHACAHLGRFRFPSSPASPRPRSQRGFGTPRRRSSSPRTARYAGARRCR